MKQIIITPQMVQDNASPIIEEMINKLESGGILKLEKGNYPLLTPITINTKNNFTLDGGGCTLVPHYDRVAEYEESSEVLHVTDSSDIVIKNLKICASMPTNSIGRVLNVTEKYADVQIDSTVPFTGDEQFISGMTYDENGVATCHYWLITDGDPIRRTIIAGEIPSSHPRQLSVPHETIGEQTFRIYSNDFDGLEKGMKCSVSHSYYGLTACKFKGCSRITIENVHISNFGGFGIVILPRCRDFTFKNLKFATDDPIHQPFALTSDGIHMTGLVGQAIFENCVFECCGDDFINIHTSVITAVKTDKNNLYIKFDKGDMPDSWADTGDKLNVYDPKTLELKGKILVEKYDDQVVRMQKCNIDISPGDFLTNASYYTDVTMINCIAKNPRSRAFVFQSINSLLIENCEFYGVHSSSIYCSTAFEFWREAGPVQNVILKNNKFYGNCQWDRQGADWSAVYVRVNGENHQEIKPVHHNISIVENHFENLDGRAIVVTLTDGLCIKNNTFKNCAKGEHIRIKSCDNVLCENNMIL